MIWSLNQLYNIIKHYRFINVINIRTSDISLFTIKKNEPADTIRETIKQRHVSRKQIKRSYDVTSVLIIIKHDHQYTQFEKRNEQKWNSIIKKKLRNLYT